MELYNLYSYVDCVDEPDQFKYLYSAHFDTNKDADECAWNETCLRYQENEKRYNLPCFDEILGNLRDYARKEGKSDQITDEMFQRALDLTIEARDEYIDYYAVPAIIDVLDYEDIVVREQK